MSRFSIVGGIILLLNITISIPIILDSVTKGKKEVHSKLVHVY